MSITREQAAKLSKQLFPHANYLIRLRERAAGVLPVNDPLMLEAGLEVNRRRDRLLYEPRGRLLPLRGGQPVRKLAVGGCLEDGRRRSERPERSTKRVGECIVLAVR